MEWDFSVKVAVFMVGVTSMLNQLLSVKSNKIKVLVTVLVGAVGGVTLTYFPEPVFMTVVGIAIGVVFYDSVLKMIGRILKGGEQ